METASTNPPYFFKSSYLSLLLDPSIRNRNKKYDEGDYRFFHIQMYYSKIYQKRNHYNSIFSPDSAIRFASSENKYAGSTSTVYGSNHRGQKTRLVALIPY